MLLFPNRALGSAGGGDSTDSDTICAPRTIVKPSVRFSSVSIVCAEELLAPGADGLFCFRLMRRNSSVSARTKFMCYSRLASSIVPGVSPTCLVKGEHLTAHLPAIIQRDSHAVVDL